MKINEDHAENQSCCLDACLQILVCCGVATDHGASFENFCHSPQAQGIIAKYLGALWLKADAPIHANRAATQHELEDAALLALIHYDTSNLMWRAVRADLPKYAGLTHKYYNMLVRFATSNKDFADCYYPVQETNRSEKGYKMTVKGLVDMDPGWTKLVKDAIADARNSRSSGLRAHCFTSAGRTTVIPGEPQYLEPNGCRFRDGHNGYLPIYQVQDSTVVKFVSTSADSVGLHTAVTIDPGDDSEDSDNPESVFPPVTLFTVVDDKLGQFEYNATPAVLNKCQKRFGKQPPTSCDAQGRLQVTRAALLKWLRSVGGLRRGFESQWFESTWLPRGVDSTIYTVNQTLVTVKATYLLNSSASTASRAPSSREGAGYSSPLYTSKLGGAVTDLM